MTLTARVSSGFSKGARHGAVLAGIGYTVAALKTAHPKFQILRGVLLAMISLMAFSPAPDGWAMFGMVMIGICGAAGGWLTLHEGRKTHVDIQPPES